MFQISEVTFQHLIAWMMAYENRTGGKVAPGRDEGGYFIEVADVDESVFAQLRFG